MKKLLLALSFLLLPGFVEALPESSFYRLQLQNLAEIKTEKPREIDQPAGILKNDNSAKQSDALYPDKRLAKFASGNNKIHNAEELVSLVTLHSPEVERQWRMFRAAQFNLSQTQALEPVIEQFAAFSGQSALLVPLSKEHPFPGITALKLEIADLIAGETREKLNQTLLDLARQARILAYRLIQLQQKLALTQKTIRLYLSLQETSESLYRNGKITLAQLTMIANEARQLKIVENRILSEKIETEQKIYAMLDNKVRPELRLAQANPVRIDQKADGEQHPEIAAEMAAAQRLTKMLQLLQRATFHEFTSLSSLQPQAGFSHPDSYKAGNMYKDSSIDFNRVFIHQLRERARAVQAKQAMLENRLKSDYNSHTASLKLARKNLEIIGNQMIPELEKAFAGVKSRYESGQADFYELIEAERRLLNAGINQIDARFTTRKLSAEILYDLGRGSIKVRHNHDQQ